MLTKNSDGTYRLGLSDLQALIEKGQKELKDMVNAQSKLLIQMAEHLISGNDIDKLKKERQKLIDHVIDK